MASFDPPIILGILTAAQSLSERSKFETEWKNNVAKRLKAWTDNRPTQSRYKPQLEWEANVAEYVSVLYRATKPPRTTSKSSAKIKENPPLKPGIPIYGPRFVPPSFVDNRLRRWGNTKPEIAYLRPINVIHPVYYPSLSKCPHCGSSDVRWDGWNGTGSREVHGLQRQETALGYQLRHDGCIADAGQIGTKNRCFAATSADFWEKWEHWEIPRGIPYFRKRSAVTQGLLNFIIEMRPNSTSGGLAENIKQLHLQEYHQHAMEYLRAYTFAHPQPVLSFSTQSSFTVFSPPDSGGYNDDSITDDLITDLYIDFVETTRKLESGEYLRNLTAISMGLDNTFKVASKATIVENDKSHKNLMKGGVLSVLNELNDIISWRFCQSESPSEIFEVLEGIKARCKALGVDLPEIVVVDNCCHVRNKILESMPDIAICLDVYHFMMRYLAAVLNGAKNPHRSQIALDIRDAILKRPSSKGLLAQYWSQPEQEAKLQAVFNKWALKGVWSAAAQNVHAAQLKHVRKGCLARPREDIASDGSRIEGSHKGWNGIQRSFASGLLLQSSLCHDFVLRRNLRVAIARLSKTGAIGQSDVDEFVASTYGSHHIRLVNATATLSNKLMNRGPSGSAAKGKSVAGYPILRQVESGEVFGVVSSKHADSFGGLLTIKAEDTDGELLIETSIVDDDILATATTVLEELDLNIDPALLFSPLSVVQKTATIMTPASNSPTTSTNITQAPIIPATGSSTAFATVTDLPQVVDGGKRKEPPAAATPARDEIIPSQKRLKLTRSELVEESSASLTSKPPHPFFLPRIASQTVAAPAIVNTIGTATSAALVAPLSLPAEISAESSSTGPKLTRSQRLFAAGTGTDPRSLSIARGAEFFLFMNLRESFQWKSCNLTSTKWVGAAETYNQRLRETQSLPYIPKSPRALVDTLGQVERMIFNRIATQDFKSKTGSETFWKHHCYAVELVKTEEPSGETSGGKKTRKVATCNRCKKIMYPARNSPENHKLGYCTDGFKQKSKDGEEVPWPQPEDIFTRGTEFHPLVFLAVLREVYERAVVQKDVSGLTMEQDAFFEMFKAPGRVSISTTGAVLFKLFAGFEIPKADNVPEGLLVQENGVNYLRIDALTQSDVVIQTTSAL
ncbi:hypothetical protein C8R43DRAFT_968527 [Mycena crocata]|nr:hypothetical protein C8R43DRAFT_968527 [Mycena crocata]